MFLLLPLAILFFLSLALSFGQTDLAELFAQGFFISLLLFVFYQTIIFLQNHFSSVKNLKSSYWYSFVIRHHRVITIGFIILLFIFALFSKTYYFGGDDTRLYFLYPKDYYSNFIAQIVGDNTISNIGNFLPATSISLFLFSLVALQSLTFGANLQAALYLANILLGIFFFYTLLKYILDEKFQYEKHILFLSSCMYVFSIFNFYTLFNSRLTAVFLISVFPLSLYLFLKAFREKKLHLIVLIALILTVTTITSIASFWFLAAIIVMSPFLLHLSKNNWRRFLQYGLFFLACIILLNANWLVYLGHTTLTKHTGGEGSNSIVSENFLDQNAEGVRSTVRGNSFFYPLLNSYHRGIQEMNNWPYLPIYKSWYQTTLPFNLVFILIIFLAGVLGKKDRRYPLFVTSAISLFLSLYFFTIVAGETKFGNIGTNLFVELVNHLPGFIIFRNMYDKFGLGLSFVFATTVAISLSIVFSRLQSNKYKKIILVIFATILLLNAKPFILGEFDKLPIWTTGHLYQGTTAFNDDYMDLVSYVKNQKYQGRYAFVPLSGGNVISIQDKYLSDHYYVGVSPLLILSGKNDYSGTLSFGARDKDLYNAIYDHDYEKAGKIFQDMNVSYIIVNNDIPTELQSSYMYQWEFLDAQRDDFLNVVAGNKIRDFGTRYSLYAINQNFANEKIEVRELVDTSPTDFSHVSYAKESSSLYHVSLQNITDGSFLSFFEEKDMGWVVRDTSGNEIPLLRINIDSPYRNTWRLDRTILAQSKNYTENPDGTFNAELNLYFKPYDYYYPSLALTFFSFVILICYVLWNERSLFLKPKRL